MPQLTFDGVTYYPDKETHMFDIKELESEVDKEVAEEVLKEAKTKLKAKRKEIGKAKAIVRNLELAYGALLQEISSDANL